MIPVDFALLVSASARRQGKGFFRFLTFTSDPSYEACPADDSASDCNDVPRCHRALGGCLPRALGIFFGPRFSELRRARWACAMIGCLMLSQALIRSFLTTAE